MAAVSLRKKKLCALAFSVMLGKVENEDTGRRFWVRKIFQERKKIRSSWQLKHVQSCGPVLQH